ncbi:MAG: NAD(P)/FAD-dependent oxidoreductase [bacterium]|nr:NAD(P)/FAD-dependent oxidoreductase [bacterium]
MDKIRTEILVIGGGASGLSAGISATRNGAKVVIVDREEKLGGILKQCIHNGFGLKYYKKEMTGPEYANNLIVEAKSLNIPILMQTSVTKVTKMQNGSFKVKVVSPNGLKEIIAKAVILAMGCRERTAASISLGGTRPVGVISAGSAQKMINVYGQMIGKNVVIVGSGDVGLIMARRLYFEGANVIGVYEINSIPSGLNRNIVQCLNDYNIPLHLSETVVEVLGKDRVSGVVVAKVNPDFSFDLKTRRVIPCDTILLSVGLVPETDLVSNDIVINKLTSGAVVDDNYQTSVLGLFSCGNVLHVHDIVDDVTMESIEAGKCAALYVKNKLTEGKRFKVLTGNLVRYSVPSYAQGGQGFLTVKFRVSGVKKDCFIIARLADGTVIAKRPAKIVLPAQMEQVVIDRSKIVGDITISVEDN